jgi:cytochrome c553
MRIWIVSCRLACAVLLTQLALLVTNGHAETIEEKAQACAECHGQNGMPRDATTPIIWGQHEGYMYLQLRDYKRGTRKDEQMTPVVDLLEREDMLALAKYFAEKKWPDLRQPSAPKEVAARALRANNSVGCTGCHLGEYQGDATVPRLAGQSRAYLASSILAFRTRTRGNNPGMSDLMIATSEEDLAALAEYLAGR